MPAHHFLRRQANWEELYFYKKTVVLYQLTFAFTKRFLKVGDRTVDQMVQAARSGKQNIVEGFADGVSSTEMEIKLLNVARASIKELKEDYEDYLTARNISKWDDRHPRFATMLEYCRQHNNQEDYNVYVLQGNGRGTGKPCRHPLPTGGQDDDHLPCPTGTDLHRRRRNKGTHDGSPSGPPTNPERNHRGASPRNRTVKETHTISGRGTEEIQGPVNTAHWIN